MTRPFFSDVASEAELSANMDGSQTTMSVSGFTGWPGNTPFWAAIDKGTAQFELVSVTAVAGSTLTVVRGQGGTIAQDHFIGDLVEHVFPGVEANNLSAHRVATSNVHGVTGSLIGADDEGTLTNKTYRGAHVHVYTDAEPAAPAAGFYTDADSAIARTGFLHDNTAGDADERAFLARQAGTNRFEVWNDGTTRINPSASTRDALEVVGSVVAGDADVDTLDSAGAVTIGGTLDVTGHQVNQGNLDVIHFNAFDMNARMLHLNDQFGGGTLEVDQTSVFHGAVTMDSTLDAGGDITATGLSAGTGEVHAGTFVGEPGGSEFTALEVATLITEMGWVRNPPRAEMILTANMNIAHNTFVPIEWDGVGHDSHTGWSAGTPTRYTAQVQGRYLLFGGIEFGDYTGGRRSARWALNGSPMGRSTSTIVAPSSGSGITAVPCRVISVQLSIGDYVELQAFQSSGGTEAINSNTNMGIWLMKDDRAVV